MENLIIIFLYLCVQEAVRNPLYKATAVKLFLVAYIRIFINVCNFA